MPHVESAVHTELTLIRKQIQNSEHHLIGSTTSHCPHGNTRWNFVTDRITSVIKVTIRASRAGNPTGDQQEAIALSLRARACVTVNYVFPSLFTREAQFFLD
jgi:hypothetical protein